MKKNLLSSGSLWLADIAIFIILGVTPLFFNYFYPTSIDLNKIVVFKVFVLLLFFAVVWHLSKLKININKNNLKKLFPFGALFVFLIFSLIFSVDLYSSWFGSYARQEGVLSWLFYGLWTLLLIVRLSLESEENKLIKINSFLKIVSISGLLVSVYAIFQIIGWDFITWSEPANITGRAVSSLGQPNYLACYLVLILPFSAYLFSISKKIFSHVSWASIFIFEIIALIATGSRAALFIFLAVSIAWLIWFLAQKNILSRQKILLIFISSLVIVAIFLSFLVVINKDRFEELSNFKRGSAAVRLDLWSNGIKAVSLKPLFGYGLENQGEAYLPYYKVSDALYSRPNTYNDRAHNLILDILLTSGVVGLIFFVYFLYLVFSNLFKSLTDNKWKTLSLFIIWSLVVYLASLLFNFSVTVTNIYFWLIVALAFLVTDSKIISVSDEKKSLDLIQIVLIIGAAVIFFYGSFLEIRRFEADYYYNKCLTEIDNSEYFTALVLKNYLDHTYPDQVFLDYYNRNISLRLIEKLPTIDNKTSIFVVVQYLSATNRTLTSNNFENNFTRAFILGALGNRVESDIIFGKLVLLSPELPKIYLAWGDSLLFNRDYKNAIILFEKSYSLLPDSNNPYLNKDQLYRLNLYKYQIQNKISKILK